MIDVLLVSMPFGPLLSPSLGLSLLQPQVEARGLTCRVDYFTLPFAERIGEPLYSRITTENRAMSRAFVGEWIFSHALFDWDEAQDERYLADVLMKPPSWLGRNPTRPPAPSQVRAILRARDSAAAFVDWCAEQVAAAQPRDRRPHQRLPAASRLAGAGQTGQGAAARHVHRASAAPTAKRRWASRRCASFRSSTPSSRAKATGSSPIWRCSSPAARRGPISPA